MSTAQRLEAVYRGESVTLRVLRAMGWATLAGSSTAAYILCDAQGVRIAGSAIGSERFEGYRAATEAAGVFDALMVLHLPEHAASIIEADIAGTIVEVLSENGKPVEFGQKLFRVKKS